ncbi:hypothetical protein QWZ04_16640 [Vibrio tapetis subsp. quintayensis]|uniref:hypothetical protein n=1 Tax=Vibrio tapetis TaxID=52443 RepID=UPI0025B3EA9D|nr:hypothetical protein [Vibrio tapetis]MDN3681936.1 hypothetical protein [Vibrio tapetis subsp. quintayensis]
MATTRQQTDCLFYSNHNEGNASQLNVDFAETLALTNQCVPIYLVSLVLTKKSDGLPASSL